LFYLVSLIFRNADKRPLSLRERFTNPGDQNTDKINEEYLLLKGVWLLDGIHKQSLLVDKTSKFILKI
jgi:hypothetical protein